VPADWFRRNRNVALARISSNIKGIEQFKRKEHDGRPFSETGMISKSLTLQPLTALF